MSTGSFKNVITKTCLQVIYLEYVYTVFDIDQLTMVDMS